MDYLVFKQACNTACYFDSCFQLSAPPKTEHSGSCCAWPARAGSLHFSGWTPLICLLRCLSVLRTSSGSCPILGTTAAETAATPFRGCVNASIYDCCIHLVPLALVNGPKNCFAIP